VPQCLWGIVENIMHIQTLRMSQPRYGGGHLGWSGPMTHQPGMAWHLHIAEPFSTLPRGFT
jgi:hypothetical protein